MKVFAFKYNDMTEESSWATISLHKTKKGAYKAMRAHKEMEYNSWREMWRGGRAPHRFGRFQN